MTMEIESLGKYNIVDKIGSGGMATVYKAYDPILERHAAVKVVHPNLAEDEDFVERFKREGRILSRLQHEAIVPLYDFGDDNGRYYLSTATKVLENKNR